MKSIVMSLVLFVFQAAGSQAPLSTSPVVLAGHQSVLLFAEEFEKSTGRVLRDDFLGFSSTGINLGSASVAVYSVVDPSSLQKNLFECLITGSNESMQAKCTRNPALAVIPYRVAGDGLSIKDFSSAIEESVQIFRDKAGDPLLISKAKFWRTNSEIQGLFRWNPGSGEKLMYFLCHMHGSHFDCHRQSRPGVNEPAD